MNATTVRTVPAGLVYLLGVVFLLGIAGCNGDGSSDNAGTATERKTAALGVSVKNVQLVAAQPTEIHFTYDVPGPMTARGDYSVSITDTLKNISLTAGPVADGSHVMETLKMLATALIKDAFAQEQDQAQVTVHISYAGDPEVCSSPYAFGPYTIMGAIGAALSSDSAKQSPTDAVVDISNSGSVEVCVITTPPINAYLNVTGVAVDFEDCAEPTVEIADTEWDGTYSCDNFNIPDEEGGIFLTITRNPDGSYHYVDDGGEEYNGHMCGNKFKFTGGLSGLETESGTLVFDSATKAHKTSRWNSIQPGISGGTCTDDLGKL